MGWREILGFGKPQEAERFSQQWSASDPAFAAWWFGTDDAQESVTPYTVMGLSAVIRAIQIISVIATLPLRTYERAGSERERIPSVFDDPYPGDDGLTPFAWVETVLMHLLLYREAFLWHEARDTRSGFVTSYRPLLPEGITVKRENGKRLFEYTEDGEKKTVGSESITYIPGPSLDGVKGHPLLHAARAVYSSAISGDKTVQRMLRRGIRLGGIVTPAEGEDDFDATEGKAILDMLRTNAVGSDNAGDVVALNRKIKLQNWTSSNIESQFDETRARVEMAMEQLFGVPSHLMGNTEKQTSWGTGVAEQNLALARFTLMGWSSRIEQVLSRRLPANQFVEFDYTGLLQGTPAEEIRLLLEQTGGKPFLTVEEARKVRNLPPLTPEQKAELAPPPQIPALAASAPREPDRFADLSRYVELQATNGRTEAILASIAAREPSITVNTPDIHVAPPNLTIAPGAVQVDIAPPAITVEAAPVPEVHVAPPQVMVDLRPPMRTVIDEVDGEIVGSHEEPV